MGLMDMIRQDVMNITSNDATGFASSVLFAVTGGSMVTSCTCKALAVKHHITYSADTGVAKVNGRAARLTVSELALNAQNYPVRDSNNRINLVGHTVTWADITNTQVTYTVTAQEPNETTGLIVLILGEKGHVTTPGRLIIGWTYGAFDVDVVDTADPAQTQILTNGDVVRKQYVLNNDNTLTIPYMAGYNVLTPFMLYGSPVQDMPYNSSTGTFDFTANGGFYVGNIISFNAVLPVWQS